MKMIKEYKNNYPTLDELMDKIEKATPKTNLDKYLDDLPKEDETDEVIRYIFGFFLGGKNCNGRFIGLMDDWAAWVNIEKFEKKYVDEAIERLKNSDWDICYPIPSENTPKDGKPKDIVIRGYISTSIARKVTNMHAKERFDSEDNRIAKVYGWSDDNNLWKIVKKLRKAGFRTTHIPVDAYPTIRLGKDRYPHYINEIEELLEWYKR